MIAGLPPIYGFYTAIITPIIAALFGSSYHLISGPTTAISIVVYSTLIKFVNPETDLEAFVSLALVLTFLAGLFQFAMGLLKMGKLVNFVSHSVIIGFTAGAGILIAFKQLQHVFGINVPQGSSIPEIIIYILNHISETNWYVFYGCFWNLRCSYCHKDFNKTPIKVLYVNRNGFRVLIFSMDRRK